MFNNSSKTNNIQDSKNNPDTRRDYFFIFAA